MIDWRVVIEVMGYAGAIGVLIWKMGMFTGRLETLVETLEKSVVRTEQHGLDIADLKARITNLEKEHDDSRG